MEDLKEIGYEGGKTTHGDVRRAINENVASANKNFSEVSAAATEAQSGVAELREQLNEVSATATEAKNGVTELGQKVEGVSSVATEAQSGVTELRQQLGEVSDTATKAQTGVTELGEQLEGVSAVAQEALRAANSAQHTAETANSTAGAAKTAAEGAAADAATAKSDAATAVEAATAASSAASAASSTASTAQQTAETANSTAEAAKTAAGAAKTAAEGAAADAATAKSDAATAKSTAETASQTAATAKSTADTAKQTAEEAKASAEGLTGEVTGLGQQLDEVAADATGASDGLRQYMTQGILTEAPFPRATAEASGSFAAVGGDAALKDGEIIPWTGWLTLVLCYQTTDSAAKVKLTGYAGPTLGNCELIGETAVAASEEPRVVRITGEHDYNPRRIGSPDACMAGSSYHVNVEVKNPNAGFTMLWAVVYESDPYGNPRRRGGSLRQYIETFPCVNSSVQFSPDTDTILTDHIRYNERTGMFEMNGLVDLSWDDVLIIVSEAPSNGISSNSALNRTTISGRTNVLPQRGMSVEDFYNFNAPYAEVIARNYVFGVPGTGYLNYSTITKVILGRFDMYYKGTGNEDGLSTGLECIKLYRPRLATSLKFKSENIGFDSLKYIITTQEKKDDSTYTALTITVPASVYNKLTGGTVENWGALQTLATEKGVTLRHKGEPDYPYLTDPFYRSYVGLYNKINGASSGDIIYIHTQDYEKINTPQQDNWGELVTLAAEKNITFAQAE